MLHAGYDRAITLVAQRQMCPAYTSYGGLVTSQVQGSSGKLGADVAKCPATNFRCPAPRSRPRSFGHKITSHTPVVCYQKLPLHFQELVAA